MLLRRRQGRQPEDDESSACIAVSLGGRAALRRLPASSIMSSATRRSGRRSASTSPATGMNTTSRKVASWWRVMSLSRGLAAYSSIPPGLPSVLSTRRRIFRSPPIACMRLLSRHSVRRPTAERLAVLRAHPDLAGKLAIAGGLTADSKAEQAGAGLDRLSAAEHARFTALNTAYTDKFGFPHHRRKGAEQGRYSVCLERRIDNSQKRNLKRHLRRSRRSRCCVCVHCFREKIMPETTPPCHFTAELTI